MIRNTLLASVLSFTVASTAYAETLIGVAPEAPLFDYNSGGTTVFDATTGELAVNATPTDFTLSAGSTPVPIFPFGTTPAVTMNLSVDSSCQLAGAGSLSVMAGVDFDGDFVNEADGVVLTGDALEVGISPDSSSTEVLIDARFAITGGTLVDNGTYTLGGEVGVTLSAEGAADFAGDCSNSWSAGAKGQIGAIESITPPEELCFDVKRVKINDGKKFYRKWGWWGRSRSKIDVSLNTSCPTDFDPSQSFISVMVDGESFDFPVGSFTQSRYGNRFRARIGGRPSVAASLDCDKGRFSLNVSRADTSQIDDSDGVDIKLVLGESVSEQNVILKTNNHRWYRKGHSNVSFFNNPNPIDCSVEVEDTPIQKVKILNKFSRKVFVFSRAKGHIGNRFFVHDSISGLFKEFNGNSMSCGDSDDGGWKVIAISHDDDSKSCVDSTEDEEADDTEDDND